MKSRLAPHLEHRCSTAQTAKYLGSSVRHVQNLIAADALEAKDIRTPGAKRARWSVSLASIRCLVPGAEQKNEKDTHRTPAGGQWCRRSTSARDTDGVKIFDAYDAITGDDLSIELDGADRLVFHTTVEGRRRDVVLVGSDAGRDIARALLTALEGVEPEF
jgi:hypothetical protein